MAQIVTNNFSIDNATKFVAGYDSNYYLVIGRPQAWANEPTAPAPTDKINEDSIYWAESVATKRIVYSDLKQVIKRNNYVINSVYAQYDNTLANLLSTNFYVLTSQDFNVYKCISNNFGAVSTVKPTGKSTSIFQTADGYRWKYMYSLTDNDILKFLTQDYMPINVNQDIIDTAVKGTIDSIVVQNQGNSYSQYTAANIVGNGSGAIISTIYKNAANSITALALDPIHHGTGYSFANVSITDTTGTNVSAYAVISPFNGHGSDPLFELGAKYVMINSRLDYAEGGGDFPTVNDYRRIAIVKDPVSNITGNVATEVTLDSTFTLNLTNVTGTFSLDEIVRGDSTHANAFIVSANVVGSNVTVRYITPENLHYGNVAFRVGEIVRGNTSLATGNVSSILYPEIRHESGKFLYIENRAKITRQSDQAENIHIVIEF